MNAAEQARIIDLLKQRETALVQVWKCESKVHEILGCDFPFPAPPPLPSLAKRKRHPRKAPAAPETGIKVRRLKADREDAYRIHYRQGDAGAETLQPDAVILSFISKLDTPIIDVTKVETVRLNADGTAIAMDLLWEKPSDANE